MFTGMQETMYQIEQCPSEFTCDNNPGMFLLTTTLTGPVSQAVRIMEEPWIIARVLYGSRTIIRGHI
jgi:hypothetical protein